MTTLRCAASSSSLLPLVVLFAHPDDEFAVFPWLRQAAMAGRDVHCIWLTDGGFGGQNKHRRRLESARVLSGLGIPSSMLHFIGDELDIPDGELYRHVDRAVEALRGLGHVRDAGQMLLPAWEGGHHDHDACHLVGLALAGKNGQRLRQYSLYHGEGLSGPWFRVLSPLQQNGRPVPATTSLLERVGYIGQCFRYTSQWKSFLGLLPFYALRMFRSDAFVLQPVDQERAYERPHKGPLLYERRGGPSWERFANVTGRYKASPSS